MTEPNENPVYSTALEIEAFCAAHRRDGLFFQPYFVRGIATTRMTW